MKNLIDIDFYGEEVGNRQYFRFHVHPFVKMTYESLSKEILYRVKMLFATFREKSLF